MSKEALKKKAKVCSISGEALPSDTKLFDVDRKNPKSNGGIYTKENTRVVSPISHMKRHGTFRERPELFEKLKTRMDDRKQFLKMKIKIENQLLAYKRHTDIPNITIIDFYKSELDSISNEAKKIEKELLSIIKDLEKTDTFVKTCLGVKAVGPMTVAACLTYIDLEKARHASSLWAYAGLDKPSHKRYEKGVAGGGNKTLRSALWNMANSQIKQHGPYREDYERCKARLEKSEVVVTTRSTKGTREEKKWKDVKPSHRHGAALRIVMKHFLADYWYVGRTLAGLPTSLLYPEAILKGSHRTIMPEERGWKY